MSIKRIFFDSGKVLIYPASGHWFYPQPYFEFCKNHGLPANSFRQNWNLRKAFKFLAAEKLVETVEREEQLFEDFYRRLFRGVRGKDNSELIDLCTEYTVRRPEKYGLYDDVTTCIPRLASLYAVGMITDAWPSTRSIYSATGLLQYFDPFVVSSEHGADKSDHRLFEVALSMVDEKPNEILFVDDHAGNVKRAAQLGMKVYQLERDCRLDGTLPGGSNLSQLEKYLCTDR